ncbi:amidohydrolase/deacetylase family metallohydrolase [Enterococcus sp. BWT-B8]|uniref:amidohydrolase/deacetylase family metallohydrolase n=1 Tax=Enterococcus sp. BWT-B8 TaxID=2885157 RepID=UPI001E52943E|nr:amidohydrolase/deacetylase family metallohydrolase [Enterococcus sp. BWT-B8]MCB5952126.1 amidohydrolase/deacetylase family metallohydrolase [Enterococcus sp. BWT-B8]
MVYDLLIKNGKLIGGQTIDIAILDGKIAETGVFVEGESKEQIDLKGESFISPGWIDDHVHCFEKMTLYYDFPDEIGVKKGVTTVIDAGTTGAENIHEFHDLAVQAKTNVYALVNISKWGIVEQDELADLTKIQKELVKKTLTDLSDFVIGIKARMSKTVIGENGIKPLELAKEIQKENNNVPLMVHIGSAPPELDDILEHMSAGDILTHCFNGKANGILDSEKGKIKDFATAAYNKGIVFDIGHGTDSFNFTVAETALKEGIKAKTISTDIYIRNRENGPVYDLATTMEKLRVAGYEWSEIINKVTAAPAESFHLKRKGHLVTGYDADLTIFTIEEGSKLLTDSNGFTREAAELIKPVKTIIGGVVYDNQL